MFQVKNNLTRKTILVLLTTLSKDPWVSKNVHSLNYFNEVKVLGQNKKIVAFRYQHLRNIGQVGRQSYFELYF